MNFMSDGWWQKKRRKLRCDIRFDVFSRITFPTLNFLLGFFLSSSSLLFFCRINIFTWYRSLLFYGNKYVSRCCVTLFIDEFMNECNDEMPSLKFPWKCFVYSLAIYSKNWKWCTPRLDFYFRYIFLSLLGSPSYTCKSRTWTKWFVRLFPTRSCIFFYIWMRYNQNSIHSFQQNKHVKCSEYSNFSGEILFLSAFGYVIALDVKCLNYSFLSCWAVFFLLFIFFSLFYVSVNKILTRKRKKIMANFR